jgi:hypothetical protein
MSQPFDTFSPPPPKHDWATTAPTAVADEPELDADSAAALLDEATRQAQSQFDLRPTIMFFAAAVTVLVGYGALWLSVRHQHPYSGPTGRALGVFYGVLAAWILLNVVVMHRALSGRSSRQRRIEGLVFTPIWICVYVFQGALHHVDHNHAIAYGIYPAIAPLLIVGAAAAGYEAARGRLAASGLAVAAVVLGACAAFAGPATVWGVVGVGLCALLLVGGAAQFWERRIPATP